MFLTDAQWISLYFKPLVSLSLKIQWPYLVFLKDFFQYFEYIISFRIGM